jgi:hypothetical protein
MPFDPVSLSPASNAEAAALAFAAGLDALAAKDKPDVVEDALLEVGELLGGLSVHGYAWDLREHLARVEADLLEDAPRHEYNPGMGGNDPSQYCSSRLDDMIQQSRADDAADWEQSARALLTKVLVLLSERAA